MAEEIIVRHLDESNFEKETSSGVVLVDFWAPWCGPCKMLGPVLEEVSKEIGGKAIIAKVNVDDSPELAKRFEVRSIPAIFILKDGETVEQFVGVKSKSDLIAALEKAMN